MTKISVIIPCHNAEKYLPTCLNSVANQSLKDIEILAIHDHSQDQTLAVLEAFKKRYPNKIKVIDMLEKNGVSCARNLGLSMAQGEYIGFVDADDVISLNMYQDYTQAADSYQSDMVVGEFGLLTTDEFIKQETFRTGFTFCKIIDYKKRPDQIQSESPAVWNKIYRHSFLEGTNFFENHIFEDIAFTFPLLLRSSNVIRVGREDYLYRQNSAGIMDSSIHQVNSRILDIFDVCQEAYKEGIRNQFAYNQMVELRRKLSGFILRKLETINSWSFSKDKNQIMMELMQLYEWYFGMYERRYGANIIYNSLKSKIKSNPIYTEEDAIKIMNQVQKRIRQLEKCR